MHPFAQSHGGGENPQKVDEDAISVRIVITSPILDPIQIVFFSIYCMLDKLTFFVDTACESLSPAPPVQCCRFDPFVYSTTNDVFLSCHQYKKIMAPANLGEVPRVDSHGKVDPHEGACKQNLYLVMVMAMMIALTLTLMLTVMNQVQHLNMKTTLIQRSCHQNLSVGCH